MAKWNENADPENFEDLVDFTDYLHEQYGQQLDSAETETVRYAYLYNNGGDLSDGLFMALAAVEDVLLEGAI